MNEPKKQVSGILVAAFAAMLCMAAASGCSGSAPPKEAAGPGPAAVEKSAAADAEAGERLEKVDPDGAKQEEAEASAEYGSLQPEKRDGALIFYYKSGAKKHEANYKDGKKEGKEIRWYENGNAMEQREYKDDLRDGEWVKWYENGQKKQEKHFKNGQSHGLWKEWDENGNLLVEREYSEGQLVNMVIHKVTE